MSGKSGTSSGPLRGTVPSDCAAGPATAGPARVLPDEVRDHPTPVQELPGISKSHPGASKTNPLTSNHEAKTIISHITITINVTTAITNGMTITTNIALALTTNTARCSKSLYAWASMFSHVRPKDVRWNASPLSIYSSKDHRSLTVYVTLLVGLALSTHIV